MSRSRARSRIGKVDVEGQLGVRWLTTGDVAKRLGVAMRTVSKWIDEGRLIGIRLPGSRERRVHPSAMEAFEHGADEAFMLNLPGNVAESCSANIFIVRDGKVLTPPLSAGILDGLTRAHLLDLCRQEGITAEETDFRAGDVHSAEECFVTSTTREVMPIVRVDGRVLGQGRPGPSSRRLLDLFRASTSRADGVHASD